MKNLKKVLALVLALATVMGLGVTASAKYTDAEKIEYTEAVDVMSAIGVLSGNPDGSFNPQGNLTRVQAAKMVAYLLNGGKDVNDLYSGANTFVDCYSNWGKGYIAYVNQMGIVSGVGNGKFNPNGTLTGVALAKMMLTSLGYDAKIEGYVNNNNWQVNIINDAKEAGLLAGMDDVNLYTAITREQASKMMFNALKATMVKYENKGTEITLPGVGTIVTGNTAPVAVTTTQSWGGNINKDGVTSVSVSNPYSVQLGEKYFSDLKLNAATSADNFGAPANVWTYKDFEGKYAKDAILTYTDKVKANELADDIKDAGYKVNAVDSPNTGHDATSLTIWSNGSSATYTADAVYDAVAAKTSFGGKGVELKVYDANDDDTADTIVLTYVYAAKVTDIAKDDKDTKDDERAITVTAYMGNSKNPTITLNKDTAGFETVYANAKENDIVLVTPKGDSSSANEAWTVSVPTSVTGAVTAKKSDSITVGGKTYDIAACERAVSTANLNASKDVVLYLDNYGNAIHTTAVAATSSIDVVYVTAAWTGTGNWGATKMFQGVLTDGTVITGEYKYEDGSNSDYAETLSDLNKPYKYEKDGDTYKLIADNTDGTAGDGAGKGIGTMQVNYAINKDQLRLVDGSSNKKNYFDAGVKFVFVSGSKDEVKVTVKEGVQTVAANANNYAVISKDVDGNLVVTTVFVNTVAVTSSEDLIYVSSTAWDSATDDLKETKLTADGKKTLYGYEVYLNGAKTIVFVDSASVTKAEGFYTYTVDDETGAYTLANTESGVSVGDTIKGEIGNVGGKYYISLTDKTEVNEFDATDAKVIDTRTDGKVDTMSELKDATGIKVSVVYDKDKETVSYIFVSAAG